MGKAQTLVTPARRKRSRSDIKKRITEAFRKTFPTDTVDVSDGYLDNIHVMVVSRRFDRMSERQKRNLMWKIIDESGLSEDEKGLISLIYPISPAEIK